MRSVISIISFGLILPFLIIVSKANAQVTFAGKMYNGEDKTSVKITKEESPNDNRTKYLVLKDGVEIYEINFQYYNEGPDSIAIVFLNKANWKCPEIRFVKFESQDSKILVADYQRNMDPINQDSLHDLLFSIDQPGGQFINLYQFRSMDNTDIRFWVQAVPDSVMNIHHQDVVEFRKHRQMIEGRTRTITGIKNNITNYVDSVINDVKAKEFARKMGRENNKPDSLMLKEFNRITNTVCHKYLDSIFQFSNEEYSVNFDLYCRGDGKVVVDTTKDIYFTIGGQRNWLRDTIIHQIVPAIQTLDFKFNVESYSNPNLDKRFHQRIDADVALYGKELEGTIRWADSVLINYQDRKIPVPTHYMYKLTYKSVTKYPSWKYTVNDEGVGKFVDQSSSSEKVERSSHLEDLFRMKIYRSDVKKYSLELCTVSVNGGPSAQDIRSKNSQ